MAPTASVAALCCSGLLLDGGHGPAASAGATLAPLLLLAALLGWVAGRGARRG